MASKSVSKCCADVWKTITPYVSKSIVFLDGPVAEALHWTSGVGPLFEAGALNVKEFSSFESCPAEQTKVVFIISGQITDTAEQILEDIIKSSYLNYCTLITSLPESLHQHLAGSVPSGAGEGDAAQHQQQSFFRELEERIRGWMRKRTKINEVDIVHVPLSVACVSPSLFFLPSFSSLFSLLDTDLAAIKTQMGILDRKSPEDLLEVDIGMLPWEAQCDLKMLVSSLSCLCETLDVNEDIYCLGSTSRLIASELANLVSARARRKAAANRASLLLIDRSLDMVGPTSHNRESFADRIMAALPALDGHSCDVAVDMSALCSNGSRCDPSVLLPGCLAHPHDQQSKDLLHTLMTSKQKESLMDVNRRVVETITREKLPFDPSAAKIGRINAESLQTHLNHFKGQPNAFRKACPLLQLATACVQTLNSSSLSRWDDLQMTEKLLLQSMGEKNSASVSTIILELLKGQTKQGRSYSLEETVMFILHGYSLVGDRAIGSVQEERPLQNYISHLITQAPDNSEIIRLLVGENRSQASVEDAAKKILSKARVFGRARKHLQKFMNVLNPGSATHPASYSSLVKQVVERIFDPAKPDLVDIEYKSSGFRDLLKTGFRLLMNVGKPRPSDHPLLIIFLVGGVTCSEVKHIKDTASSLAPNTQVVVGSTRVLREPDVIGHIFGQEPLTY